MATVNLSWSAPSSGGAPEKYFLYKVGYPTSSAGSAPSKTELKTQAGSYIEIDAAQTTYSDDDTSSTNTYYYTIAGWNTGGEGELSNVATAVIP